MNYKHTLQKYFIDKVRSFNEFAPGGMQVTVVTKDGKTHRQVLLSNCMYIVAMRGFTDLPFSVAEIADIYQTEEDKNPKQRGGWQFWDKW